MKKGICIALITFGMLCGQEKKEPEKSGPPNPWTSRVVEVKNRDVREFSGILGVLGVQYKASPDLKVIALSGPPDVVEAAAKAIQRLDVPPPAPKNIELMVYPVVASREAGQGSNVPPELEGVVKQLKGVFAYQSFRVLDTMVLRVRDGDTGEASGAATVGTDPSRWTVLQLKLWNVTVTAGEKGNTIRIGQLKFGARVPAAGLFLDLGFTTAVDLREGQKVVVGKANIEGPNNAMILVVTGKVVE